MRTMLICAATLGIALAFGGCGIPQEQHDAVVKDFEACKKNLSDTKNKLASAEGDKDKLKGEVDALAKKKADLLKAMGASKKELEALRKAQAAAEARARVYKQLMARLQSMIDSGKLKVEIRKGRMIVNLSDKILFDPGKTKLKEDGQKALKEVAAALKDITDRDFLVAGHTDNVPIKSKQFKSNWELSAARGVEVVKFLQAEGVDPKHLGAAGFSEYDPVGNNDDAEGKKSNRRIEIVLMPNIEEMPKMD
jgi:chemotaxis protein MotB